MAKYRAKPVVVEEFQYRVDLMPEWAAQEMVNGSTIQQVGI
ncbi:hypothetical protein LKI_01870 [Leuconostoc kimchii IMSNU 11154]|uniref:Uncharacterized protein n=1 Tax=Leuconostoc kimchii (strain IMSNU 11154 / KCTC 2386 / IH25) TaxID=762051 RepID=D5T0W8_LEUKI|nr:hypothetical protein LKI_01870 [Leuconostoc kimchii IMSNU 11154]